MYKKVLIREASHFSSIPIIVVFDFDKNSELSMQKKFPMIKIIGI